MTLATIGDNTGSKSQCFYVIYDTHMVVKIPPTPISGFDDYLARVRAEAKIMRKLAPKKCVIPNVSVILKKIHTFPQADKLTANLLEREYVQWLRISPEYQRFLKVAGNFAFFMDLAKYYFLSHVVGGFHSTGRFIDEELRVDIDILTDVNRFEGKYGTPGSEIWPDLHHAYKEFQREIRGAMAQADEHIDLSDWQIKNLFLSRTARREPQIPALNVSDRFNAHLEARLRKLSEAQHETGLRYQRLLNYHIKGRLYYRSRKSMGAMATNLLALLSWLGENHVAMRDLKPDNLLVAGNPHDYPRFLSSAQHYTIGLIDLETAVDFERRSHPAILQPRLGGTPYYGTPSHFFPNQLLQYIHKDLPLVFHLQDWYAIVGIIYEVITGEILFQRTAGEISRQMKIVMQTVAQKGDLKSAYVRFALQFWDSSAKEFKNKLQLSEQRLKAISAGIPENTQRRLKNHIQVEHSKAERRIAQCLDSNAAFNKGDNRRRLEQSTVQNLKPVRAKYAGRKNSQKLVGQIDDLIGLKQQTENLAQMGRQLKTHLPTIPVKTILEMMFAVVHGNMRPDITAIPEEIPQVPEPEETPAEALDETAQLEQTQVLGCSVTVQIE
jgi:serine/threonine protein kinase